MGRSGIETRFGSGSLTSPGTGKAFALLDPRLFGFQIPGLTLVPGYLPWSVSLSGSAGVFRPGGAFPGPVVFGLGGAVPPRREDTNTTTTTNIDVFLLP